MATHISDDNRKYDKVLEKFDEFFKIRHNIIFERACFNKRNQKPGKMAEDYITILHQLAGSCEYGEIKDEMIRDRLMVGIRDESLLEHLQMEVDLTLDKAKMLVRQIEAVQQQQGILKDESEIEAVNVKHKKNKTGKTQRRPLNTTYKYIK